MRIGDENCGRTTGRGYGYTARHSLAYAYWRAEHAESGGQVAVEIFGTWIEDRSRPSPLFDPNGGRMAAESGLDRVRGPG